MTENDLPRCRITDLVRVLCAHCRRNGYELTRAERDWLGTPPGAPTHLTPSRRTLSHYQAGRGWAGTEEGGEPAAVISCSDGHDRRDRFLCNDCSIDLVRHLTDVPYLVEDLKVAYEKDVSFGDRAVTTKPDEAPVNFNIAAADALDQLRNSLPFPSAEVRDRARYHTAAVGSAARWMLSNLRLWLRNPDIDQMAHRISRACVRARNVIDRPRDITFYGECPECKKDIRQERVDPKDAKAEIRCPNCTYVAKYSDHEQVCLNAGVDRWLTRDEMLGAVRAGTKVVTRKQLNWWIERDGLPRETRNRPVLVDGEIAYRPVDVFRLGDVLALADAAELDQRSLTTAEAAAYLNTTPANIRQMVHRGRLEPNDRRRNPLKFSEEKLVEFRNSAEASGEAEEAGA